MTKDEIIHSFEKSLEYAARDGRLYTTEISLDTIQSAITALRADAGYVEGLEAAAHFHDERRRLTPDAFEMEFHEACAKAIRIIAASPSPGKVEAAALLDTDNREWVRVPRPIEPNDKIILVNLKNKTYPNGIEPMVLTKWHNGNWHSSGGEMYVLGEDFENLVWPLPLSPSPGKGPTEAEDGFEPSDFADLHSMMMEAAPNNDARLSALASNNFNVILAALKRCGGVQ